MRSFLVLILAFVGVLAVPLQASTQEATPVLSRESSGGLSDLPALMISASDLEKGGLPGIRMYGSELLFTPEGYVATYSLDSATKSDLLRELVSAGFLGGAVLFWQIADQDSGSTLFEVNTILEEYADAEGAARALEAQAQASTTDQTFPRELAPGNYTVGEQSQIIVEIAADGAATPIAAMETPALQTSILFRVGKIVATIDVGDHTRTLQTAAEMETLAELFKATIEAGLAGGTPDMSSHILRFVDATPAVDSYIFRNGETFQWTYESEDDLEQRQEKWANVVDLYEYDAYLPSGGEGYDDDAYVYEELARFPDEAAATEFMAALADRVASDPDVTPRESSQLPGDGALATTAVEVAEDGTTTYYSSVYVREGATIIHIVAPHPDTMLSAKSVDDLVTAAMNCLQSNGWCDPVQIPAGLVTPAATPEA